MKCTLRYISITTTQGGDFTKGPMLAYACMIIHFQCFYQATALAASPSMARHSPVEPAHVMIVVPHNRADEGFPFKHDQPILLSVSHLMASLMRE